MPVREIRKYPDAVLKQKSGRVEMFDEGLRNLIQDMLDTMYAASGVGLAANQVGIPLRVAVIDTTARKEEKEGRRPPIVLINPEIISMEGSVVEEEGCLSMPECFEKVNRAAKVKVRAQDMTGMFFEIEGEGLLAKALQHEIDHLNGILFIDRLSPLKRDFLRRRLRKAAAAGVQK